METFERIIEIIVMVMIELQKNVSLTDIDTEKLQDLGYTKSEISTAFSWLVDRIEFGPDVEKLHLDEVVQKSQQTSFRILQDEERMIFTPDAWGELVQMRNLGLIDNELVESIIERATMFGLEEITKSDLHTIIALLLFNAQQGISGGSRFILNGRDKIN